jgi:short-subunit dehydrogenase
MDVTRAFLPHFRANGGGGVIMISSGGGFWGLPLSTMYNASKFALEGFTESLSYECASQNIFVKSVVPHGGVSQTAFGKRAMGEMPDPLDQYQDYSAFTKKMWENFQKMSDGISISSMDVANSVLEAATDGTNRLRYWVGNDTRGFVRAVYSSKHDEEYMGYMRSFFT